MTPSAPDADAEALKREAGIAALAEVRSGMTLGLGTGSTVRHFLEALGAALGSGSLGGIRGVPTSEDTASRARALRIPLVELHEAGRVDLAVDGADEVTSTLDLVKGLGGAHLREKMVVQASDRFVVVADAGKRVRRLGERAPLPVEVVPFGWRAHLPFFRDLGADPVLRIVGASGEPFLTDNRNLVVDLAFTGGIPDPVEVEASLRARAGIVETGLFLGVAARCYLAAEGRVEILDAPPADPNRAPRETDR
jgi:ribose 5-phosphate isomerase A